MKKIALLFPYLRESGICKVPAIHSTMFSEQGYEVDLIVRDDVVEYPYDGNLINLNIKTRKGLFKVLTYFELLFKVYCLKRQKKYDVVISHTPHCNLINVLTKFQEKSISTTHITSDFHNAFASLSLGYVLKKSEHMVVVSKLLASSLHEKFPPYKRKISCIYNPMMDEYIQKQTTIPVQGISSPYLLSVGRLSKQKAHWSLIKAFSLIVDEHPDLNLVILGEGNLETELRLLAEKLGLQDRVLFKGFDNNPYRYMKYCELFVLSSLNEGFPLVLLEALGAGAAILSSDCVSGPREIITPSSSIDEEIDYDQIFEYGYLYSNNGSEMNFDADYIAEADRKLAGTIKTALADTASLNCLKKVGGSRLEGLSVQAIYKEWETLIK